MLVPAIVMATVHVPVNHGIPIAHNNLRRRRHGACKHCRHGHSYNATLLSHSSLLLRSPDRETPEPAKCFLSEGGKPGKHAISVRVPCSNPVLGADAFHREVDRHVASFSKTQGCLDVLAFLEGLLQSDEHHVITAELELHRLTRLDVKAAEGAASS